MPPTTTYDTATLVNPTGTLTDYSTPIDLSRLTTPWWDAVNTTDGTRGRVFLDSGVELAVDWNDFDSINETGWIRVLIPSWLTSSTIILHIYPPNTANAAVAAADTYGQYSAYAADVKVHAPMTNGSFLDRTSNGHNGTPSFVFDPLLHQISSGPFGTAMDCNGNGFISFPATTIPNNSQPHTYSVWWHELNSGAFTPAVSTRGNAAHGGHHYWRKITANQFNHRHTGGGFIRLNYTAGSWNMLSATRATGPVHSSYINGVESVVVGTSPGNANTNTFLLGANNTGQFSHHGFVGLSVYYGERPAAWHQHEYEMVTDQVGMVGAWTNVPEASGARRRAMVIA